jgi:hypothetical protein
VTNGGSLGAPEEWSHVIILDYQSKITEISMLLHGPHLPPGVVDDVLVRLYTTSGIQSGVPVDLLWTGVLEDIVLTVNPALFTIEVPEVLVPRVFAFSTERASGLELRRQTGLPHPAHFGQWGTWAWYENGMWNNVGGVGFVPIAARFKGVSTGIIPEPASAIMLFSAAAGLITFRRRRID